jgi:hypothetical protein
MNERIKTLAEQSGADDVKLPHGYRYALVGEESLQKFAELIVQDYANKTIQALVCDPAFVQAMDEYYERKWAHRFD